MIIGTCISGMKCIYDIDGVNVDTIEQFESLIYGYNENPAQREELQGQPKLLGLNGPMFNGYATLKSTGETMVVIRYEKPREY